MSEHDAPTADPTAELEGQITDSPMERIRELRRKSRQRGDLTLEIPGYDGQLGI